MTRLLHRVKPYKSEDVKGFFKRVALVNFLKSGPELLRSITGNQTRIYKEDIPRLAHYCLNSVAELAQLSGLEVFKSGLSGMWQINGERISKSTFIASRYPKICPMCLQEAPYLRGSWLLTLYVCCPIHKTLLVDKCQQCNRHLKSNRTMVEYCNCGTDLRNLKAPRASPASLFLAQLIDHRQDQDMKLSITILANREIERLASLSLDGLCKTIWFLGHYIANLGAHRAGQGRKIYTIDESELVIHQALNLLHDWPNSFGNQLTILSKRKPSASTDSLINRLFGPAQHYLNTEINDKELLYVRSAYEQHIRKIWLQFDKRTLPAISKTQLELDLRC